MKLQTALCVWRPMLPSCPQPSQATGHWNKSPPETMETPLHACKVMLAEVPTPSFGFLPRLHGPSACDGHSVLPQGGPLARRLIAVLKRKQVTAWDLVLSSCLWTTTLNYTASCQYMSQCIEVPNQHLCTHQTDSRPKMTEGQICFYMTTFILTLQ